MSAIMTDENDPPPHNPPGNGMPRWLIYGLLAKLVLVVLITLAVVWYAFGR